MPNNAEQLEALGLDAIRTAAALRAQPENAAMAAEFERVGLDCIVEAGLQRLSNLQRNSPASEVGDADWWKRLGGD